MPLVTAFGRISCVPPERPLRWDRRPGNGFWVEAQITPVVRVVRHSGNLRERFDPGQNDLSITGFRAACLGIDADAPCALAFCDADAPCERFVFCDCLHRP